MILSWALQGTFVSSTVQVDQMWTEVVEPFIKAHRKLKLPMGSKGKDLYRSGYPNISFYCSAVIIMLLCCPCMQMVHFDCILILVHARG